MMKSKNKLLKKTSSWIVVAALSFLTALNVQAASTDISVEPLTTVSDIAAKPNIMFILDDSGSMNWSYMPDDLGNGTSVTDNPFTGKYGYWSSQCNGVAYNPTFNYALPVKADGTTYANSNFSSAWTNGFSGAGSVDLGATTTTTVTSNRNSATTQTVGTGSKNFVITETDVTATSYTVGTSITFESGTRRMTGPITAWNSGTRTITVNVTSINSTGSRSAWTVTSTTEVTTPNVYYYAYTGTQPAMGWTYDTGGAIATTFYNQCMSDIGSTPGSGVFTRVDTTTFTTAQQQNYANWYSYYRKRFLLMRTAVGRAFQPLDSGYRVGFSAINDTSVTSTSFLDSKDFDTTHKASFYSKLYTQAPNGSTPLRSALAKVGQYYAKKATDQTYDPMQYSCQRNYAMLSTDGYWNGGAGKKLDGTTNVGNQDGTADRPMRDSTKAVVTTVTPTTTTVRRKIDSTYPNTTIWTRYRWTTGSTSTTAIPVMTQRRTQTSAVTNSVVRDEATTVTRTVVTTDGVVTSDTSVTGATVTTTVSTATTGTFTAWGDISSTNKTLLAAQFNSSGLTISSTYYSGTCNSGTGGNTVGGGSCGFSTSTETMGATGTAPAVTSSVLSTTPVVGTATSTNSTSGGAEDSLADVAQYYYTTDLRTTALGNCTSTTSGASQDTCENTLKPSGRDSANYQHMTTYSIGLGVNGTLVYDKNYLTQTTGDYIRLKNGTVNWPDPGSDRDAVNIDDLWHAAVNGRGQYYSALDAGALSQAISGVLTSVTEEVASSSAAATSALELIAGEANEVFKASYTTVSWTGDLQSFSLNGTTGAIGTTANWSAQAKLDAKDLTTRKIYYRQAPATSTLREFTYTNLSADGLAANFDNLCSKTLVSGQCATLSAPNLTLANSGTNLVNYLRGVRTYEGSNSTSPLYRTRSHLLGDIINGAPVYVGGSPFAYSDVGYAAFSASKAARKKMIYVGSNDGMLHAISSQGTDAGEEVWAYVPRAVMPNMYKLADTSYASRHQYLVDGMVVVGDISVGGVWKTILVGGLNSGGKSYYALDITDPANPLTLWEFTDTNLGLTYGNPIITKRADGTWVVAFTSGYNNADGKGRLYLVNADTGELLENISTGIGSSGSPSGLAKINAWIDQGSNNTTTRFYGGDVLGNLWRFDIDNLYAPNKAAMLLATFQIDATTPQPITTRPELSVISGSPVVVVGTGRYLGSSDITNSVQQSIYAVKDPLTAVGWGDIRSAGTLVDQPVTVATTGVNAGKAVGSTNAVDWSSKSGWKIDFPNSRERVAINMSLQFNTLAVTTAIPNGDACSSGGSSWLYYLNVASGSALMNGNVLGSVLSQTSLAAGLSWVKLSNGTTRIIVQDSSGALRVVEPPESSSSVKGPLHRTSWRELVD